MEMSDCPELPDSLLGQVSKCVVDRRFQNNKLLDKSDPLLSCVQMEKPNDESAASKGVPGNLCTPVCSLSPCKRGWSVISSDSLSGSMERPFQERFDRGCTQQDMDLMAYLECGSGSPDVSSLFCDEISSVTHCISQPQMSSELVSGVEDISKSQRNYQSEIENEDVTTNSSTIPPSDSESENEDVNAIPPSESVNEDVNAMPPSENVNEDVNAIPPSQSENEDVNRPTIPPSESETGVESFSYSASEGQHQRSSRSESEDVNQKKTGNEPCSRHESDGQHSRNSQPRVEPEDVAQLENTPRRLTRSETGTLPKKSDQRLNIFNKTSSNGKTKNGFVHERTPRVLLEKYIPSKSRSNQGRRDDADSVDISDFAKKTTKSASIQHSSRKNTTTKTIQEKKTLTEAKKKAEKHRSAESVCENSKSKEKGDCHITSLRTFRVVQSGNRSNFQEDVTKALEERNRKNAELAKQNRLKKKAYIESLEQEVEQGRERIDQLEMSLNDVEEERDTLRREVQYLKSVLANSSPLADLLKHISSVNNVSLSSSVSRKRLAAQDQCPTSAKKSRQSESLVSAGSGESLKGHWDWETRGA